LKNVINNILAFIFNFVNLVLCAIRSERRTYRGRWWVPLKPKNLISLFRLAMPSGWEMEVWGKHHFDGGDFEWWLVMVYTDPHSDEQIPLTVYGATCLGVAGMRWVFVGSNPIPYRWVNTHFEETRWVVCNDDRWFGR
jgi:hypothetical protein